ncbi:MAG TPA: V-type ATPase 116kDa subunit family protein [candidate division Zixibacteria bacterium]|nr:V-type ATPase 116kDa subunit family protein [candidate division Zixibacteria bacterium]
MSLLPDRMKTVKVVIPKTYSRHLQRYLSTTDNLEIIDAQKKPFDINSFENGAKIKNLSEKFDEVVEHFDIKKKVSKRQLIKIDDSELGPVLKDAEMISKETIEKLSQINDRITLAEQELEKNRSAIEVAKNLIPFGFSFEDLDDERPYFNIIVGRIEATRVPRFKWNLDAITDSNYVFKVSQSKGNYSFVAIGFLERYQDDINRLLAAYGFEKSSIPERISGTPEKVIKKSEAKIVDLEHKIVDLKKEADLIIKNKGAEVLGYTEQFQIEQNYLKIANMMRDSKRNVTFWGWVPEKQMKKIEKDIQKTTENNALIEFTKPVFEESEFPTKTSVPKFARIYDGLVSAYGVPGYNEFNSAILLQIFFPIMFGIMFADVGHGLLFALLGVYGLTLQNKKLGMDSFMDEIKGYFKDGAMLMIVSGVVAMIFGVLFGSYFGVTYHAAEFVPKPVWFSPEGHEFYNGASPVILMLELSLLIGMIHMTIGYVLRFIKNIRQKHYLEAICVTLMWSIFHWSLFVLVFTFGTNFMEWFDINNSGTFDLALLSIGGNAIQFFTIPSAMWFFLLLFALPILVMTAYLIVHGFKHGSLLDGVAELIELLLSTLSNTVSYARIFAMNAVHGALSHIFTLQEFTSGEGLGVINYIGVAIGALVILALEGLFSFIQTLRLQWVEFFAKVGYQGTGYKFHTMAIERKYSIVN